jgi:DNA-binding beta-propeller fold protein YncE
MICTLRPSFVITLLIAMMFALGGCGGSEQASEEQGSSSGQESASSGPITNSENAPSAPEAAESPQPSKEPAGEVVDIGDEPEGVVVDPETGLVAVALWQSSRLALIDINSREVVQNVELPGSARHLSLAGPGGPVLVPVETADTFAQVSLPEGEVTSKTSVGDAPHNAAAAPNGRIFVVNEAASTISVIENDSEIDRIEAPLTPGGVAVTSDGLVGVVGVRGLDLEIYDASSLKAQVIAGAGKGPTHVKVGPEDRFYVVDTRGDAILVYEANPEPEQVGNISLPGTPYGIDVDPERGQLWVTLTAENQVVQLALEGDTLRELARYPTVRQPNSVAVDPDSGRVFITGSLSGELQILKPS